MKKETVEIVRQKASGRHGDKVQDGDPIPVRGCIVLPRTGVEESTGGEVIIDGWQVIIDRGRPVPRATDAVRVRGLLYEVVGTPGDYDKKVIVILRKVGQSSAGA